MTIHSKVGAAIVSFNGSMAVQNHLTITDHVYVQEWGASHALPMGAQIRIHTRSKDDAPEISDYISVYRADDGWAVWNLARAGRSVTVWNGTTGSDLGMFGNMKEALAAVPLESLLPRNDRRRLSPALPVESLTPMKSAG